MKNSLTISLLSLLIIAFVLYMLFKDIMSKIIFSVGLQSTSTGIKTWNDVTNFLSGSGALTFNFAINVTNASWLSIRLRDLETKVYYKGQLIGKPGLQALKNININAGSYKSWVEPIELAVNKQILSMLVSDLATGTDPELSYTTSMRIYGIRYTYSDKVKIIETTLSSL